MIVFLVGIATDGGCYVALDPQLNDGKTEILFTGLAWDCAKYIDDNLNKIINAKEDEHAKG